MVHLLALVLPILPPLAWSPNRHLHHTSFTRYMSLLDATNILISLVVVVLIIVVVRCRMPSHASAPPPEGYVNAASATSATPLQRLKQGHAACNTSEAVASLPPPHADGPAPVGYRMGDYDGVPLRTECSDSWRHPPCDPGITVDGPAATVLGNSVPLRHVRTVQDFPTAPEVNGQGSPRDMFLFAYNKSSPACCPSTYSTSTGCVCTTPEQRRLVSGRGMNHYTRGSGGGVAGTEW